MAAKCGLMLGKALTLEANDGGMMPVDARYLLPLHIIDGSTPSLFTEWIATAFGRSLVEEFPEVATQSLHHSEGKLKGQCHKIFCFWFFS
jgi:hypothetical protein